MKFSTRMALAVALMMTVASPGHAQSSVNPYNFDLGSFSFMAPAFHQSYAPPEPVVSAGPIAAPKKTRAKKRRHAASRASRKTG